MALPLLALGGIAAKGLTSLIQGRRARKIEKNNPFVTEQVNPLLQQNVAEAENMARVGMPQEQFNNRLNLIQRGISGALSRFGRNGGSTGSLASIVRAGNDATADLVADDVREKQQNRRFLFGQRGILANEQKNVWDYNNKQKYAENAASIAQQIGAGKQNAFGALNDMTQLAMLSGMDDNNSSSVSDPGFEQNRGIKRLFRGRRGAYIGPAAQSAGVSIPQPSQLQF